MPTKIRPDSQWNGPDSAGIGCHILAQVGGTVAAGEGLDQLAVFVPQVQRKSVDLGLDHDAVAAAKKGLGLINREDVVQAQHRPGVLDLGKVARDVRADALGRRARKGAAEGLFQLLELAQQGVELEVGDRRFVFDVVGTVVSVDLFDQIRLAALKFSCGRHDDRILPNIGYL